MYFKLQDFKGGETGEYSVCCSVVLSVRQTLIFGKVTAIQSVCFLKKKNLVFTGIVTFSTQKKHFWSAPN